MIIETFQEQEQTRKQSLLGGLHQFNIESKNEKRTDEKLVQIEYL